MYFIKVKDKFNSLKGKSAIHLSDKEIKFDYKISCMRNFAVYSSVILSMLIACNGKNEQKKVLTSVDGVEYVKLEPIIKDASEIQQHIKDMKF
jgi:hypothetical protein